VLGVCKTSTVSAAGHMGCASAPKCSAAGS
jgi:hypothetical protein